MPDASSIRRLLLKGIALLSLGLLGSCSTNFHRKSADHETFRLLKSKGEAVVNMESGFHIDPPDELDLLAFSKNKETADFLGEASQRESEAAVLKLDDALALGVTRSRTYLARKEALYLDGLELTLARHAFTPLFVGTGSGQFESVPTVNANGGATDSATAAEASAAAASVASGIDNVVRENTFAKSGSLSFSSLQRTGARLTADLTTDFLRFLTGNVRSVNSSAVAARIAQPLLRGAGHRATMETLTQAERSLLYEVRDFSRFRKSFAVDIASRYYEVLQARDAARNAWLANQAFASGVARAEALHRADRLTPSELGLLQQAALQAELQWVNAVASYELNLDQFKIELGLPVEEKIILDPTELDKLEIINPTLSQDEAIQIALASRLDYQTALQQQEDSSRRIGVAANALKPGLDLVGGVDVGSGNVSGRPSLEFDRPTWSAGVDLDLPLDTKAERNAYRSSLIDLQRAERDLELSEDQIKLDIIDGFRDLERARRQYEISQLGVQLSEKRLAAERAFLEAGRSTARDLVEAQLDYVESLNQLTAAKVEHTISRLAFWRDLGILFIKPNGQWVKKLEAAP